MAIDYSRYYRAYAEMKDTLDGDYAHEYLTAAMADGDKGNDDLSGNAYNRVIDMEWVEMIEGKLGYIEKAIDEQRKFIEEHKEVDRIDKVKQVGKDAVQHLTQHANLIMAIEPDGSVIPERLLNTHREDSFATYENRFLHTLIFKTIAFVEARFRALQDAPNDSAASMKMERELMLNSQKFGFSINYHHESHDRDKVDREEDISLLTDYERIERIRMRLDDFVGTDLMKALKGCIAVKSPINKTNCIKQDPAFKQCYDLWVFIEGYRKSGYVLEKNVFEGQMPEEVQKDMYDVMAFQHFVATINTNHALRDKLKAEYVAENERRARDANKPEEEIARYIEDKIYEARREEMALRLKEVREREIVIARLTSELEQAKEQIRIRDLKIKELESTINGLKKELEQTREELRKAQVRIMDLEKENEQLKARIAELEAQVAALNAQIAAHVAAIASLENRIKEIAVEIDSLKAENEQLKAQIASQAQRISEQDIVIRTQTQNITGLKTEIKGLNKTIEGLNTENDGLKNTIDDQKKVISEQADMIGEKMVIIDEDEKKIADLDGKLTTLTAEHNDLTQKFNVAQDEMKVLNETLMNTNNTNALLNHDIRVHTNTISAKDAIIATLRNEKAALSQRIDGVSVLEDKAKADIASAAEKVAAYEAEHARMEKELSIANSTSEHNKTEVAKMKAEMKLAEAKNASDMQAVRDECDAKIEALRKQYEAKIDELEAQAVAAATFTDEQKYTIRLNAEKKAIQRRYDEDLADATKRAKKFVKRAKVLVDDRPEVVLRMQGVEEYIK